MPSPVGSGSANALRAGLDAAAALRSVRYSGRKLAQTAHFDAKRLVPDPRLLQPPLAPFCPGQHLRPVLRPGKHWVFPEMPELCIERHRQHPAAQAHRPIDGMIGFGHHGFAAGLEYQRLFLTGPPIMQFRNAQNPARPGSERRSRHNCTRRYRIRCWRPHRQRTQRPGSPGAGPSASGRSPVSRNR